MGRPIVNVEINGTANTVVPFDNLTEVSQAIKDINHELDGIAVPDDEDITAKEGFLKLSDKEYSPETYSGLGRIYLRKNIIEVYEDNIWAVKEDGDIAYLFYSYHGTLYNFYDRYEGGLVLKNHLVVKDSADYDQTTARKYSTDTLGFTDEGGVITIELPNGETITSTELNQTSIPRLDTLSKVEKNAFTQQMFQKQIDEETWEDIENTIYIIQYDYDLNGKTITIPEGCVLEFDGGSLNNGIIVGQNTTLSKNVKICNISGTFNNDVIYTSWFVGNPVDILNCISNSGNTLYVDKDITLDGSSISLDSLRIDGDGSHAINNPQKITLTGSLLSIKNILIDNVNMQGSGLDGVFISVGGTSRNIEILLDNVCFNGGKNCSRFLSRQGIDNGESSSIVNAKISISNCKIHDVLEFCIKYGDFCSAIIENNIFYNIGSTEVDNYSQVCLQLGSGYNGTFSSTNSVIRNNIIKGICCVYKSGNEDKETHGILVYGDYNEISGNFIDEIVSEREDHDPGSESEGIYLKGSYNIVSNNTLKYANGGGQTSDGAITIKGQEGGQWESKENTITLNTIHALRGTCITLYGINCEITKNTITYSGDSSEACILIAYSKDILISDNMYKDTVTKSRDNASTFVACTTTDTGYISIKNNTLNCATIGDILCENCSVTFENNYILLENIAYSTDTKYQSLLYTANQSPTILLSSNYIRLINVRGTALTETIAKISMIGNNWSFESSSDATSSTRTYFNGIVRGKANKTNQDIFLMNENYNIGDNAIVLAIFKEDANVTKQVTGINLISNNMPSVSGVNCISTINTKNKTHGTTEERNAMIASATRTVNPSDIGLQFFDETLGKPIYLNVTLNGSSYTYSWIKADGTAADA